MFVSTSSSVKNYILNYSQATEYDISLVGEKSLNLANLSKLGVPVPEGFVLSSKTFDDFLFSNGFIPQIQEINSKLIRGALSPKKAETQISKLILSGSFPRLMQDNILKAYNMLSGPGKFDLKLDISSINPELKESIKLNNETLLIADNFDILLNKIKLGWTLLFTQKALEFRLKNKYKGVLSLSILVTKFMQPEISGRSYTLAVDNANPNFIEIRAVYGIAPEIFLNEKFPDRYLIDKSTEQIVSRDLNKQDWMYIWSNNKLSKIKIDNQRLTLPKLNDLQILKLNKTVIKFKEYFKNELKIDWYLSSGRVYFTEMTRLREDDVVTARLLLTKTPKTTQKNKAIPVSQERFDLKPINDLTRVANGHGNNRGIVYGRAKIVRGLEDLESARGTDILITSRLPKRLDLTNIRFRGLLVQERLRNEITQIPTISNIKDIMNLILENEVITIDTKTGNVYLGAGFYPVAKEELTTLSESVKPETLNAKEIKLTMQRPVTHGLFKTNLVNTKPSDDWLPEVRYEKPQEMVEQEVASINKENTTSEAINTTDEWYLKSPQYQEEDIFESGSEYLQLVNIENPRIISSTNGVYIRLSSIFQSLDLDSYEISRNNPLKRRFIDYLESYLLQYIHSDSLFLVLDTLSSGNELIRETSILDFQLDLVKRLKFKTELKNVSIVLPDVRSDKELLHLKKIAVSSGIRRTATFKIYTEIASPLGAISVGNIVDEGIDAIVIDLDKLNKNLGSDDLKSISPEVLDFVSEVAKKLKKTTVPYYICVEKISLTDDDIKLLVEAGIYRFIFPEAKITTLSPIIGNIEVKSLNKTKSRRGRSIKDIKYG